MRTARVISTFVVLLVVCLAAVACIEQASREQIETACQNLTKLTPGSGGDEAERLNKCKQDLERESLSAEAARCRAKATDVDTFWNKCR